jgi:hypothetical protein
MVHSDFNRAIPADDEDLDEGRPEWLPVDALHLGGEDGWKLKALIPLRRVRELERMQQAGEVEEEDVEEVAEEVDERLVMLCVTDDMTWGCGCSNGNANEAAERAATAEFQEQVRTGTTAQMEREQRERVVDMAQCIKCGGTDDSVENIIICDGTSEKYNTRLHQHPAIGWHVSCLPDEILEMSRDELEKSHPDQEWCCKACAELLATQEKWLPWKIVNQTRMRSREMYEMMWLGSQPTSNVSFCDVRGSIQLSEWRKKQ